MPNSNEGVWQFNLRALFEKLDEAQRLEEVQHDQLAAEILRATTYYSFFLKRLAVRHARRAYDLAVPGEMVRLTDGQCDVLGTILMRVDLHKAEMLLRIGLQKNPPPHSVALLRIGLAEIAFRRGDYGTASQLAFMAHDQYGVVQNQPEDAEKIQAMRQFSRVFRRAMILFRNLDEDLDASYCEREGWRLVIHPQYGSRSQKWKFWLANWFG